MKWKYCGRAKVLPEIMSKKSCEYCSSQCGLLSALSWMNKPLTIKLHWMGKKKILVFRNGCLFSWTVEQVPEQDLKLWWTGEGSACELMVYLREHHKLIFLVGSTLQWAAPGDEMAAVSVLAERGSGAAEAGSEFRTRRQSWQHSFLWLGERTHFNLKTNFNTLKVREILTSLKVCGFSFRLHVEQGVICADS